ncbi:MAG: VWA domain-containing protein [Planctomycetes bacterium]|nr:VWA domain-containing protein [Planctomycetota bacterium]
MVDELLYPLLVAAAAFLLAAAAEALHVRRVRRVATLAFGPGGRARAWTRIAPISRVLAATAAAWGLATLLWITPARYEIGVDATLSSRDPEHILIALDVSPSMRLVDAGPKKLESRMARARALLESFFDRVPLEVCRVSVVAFYNGAKPVVVDTQDFEVVRNILGDLPMHYAFEAGRTKLFDGLEEATKLAKPWNPKSTTLIVLSDGDTVPATGMPRMPPSVRSVLVVGVGDPTVGKFIDGRHSRQDVSTLKQVAARLGGSFHNGNEKQLSSALIAEAMGLEDQSVFARLERREYALIAALVGGAWLALLGPLLAAFGTAHRPGPRSVGLLVPEPSGTRAVPGSRANSARPAETSPSARGRIPAVSLSAPLARTGRNA